MSWRVWEQHWLIVYTSEAEGDDGIQECQHYFQDKYEGNVRDSEWRVVPADAYCDATLQLKLPTVVGEYRDREQAEELRDELADADPDNKYPLWVTELGSPADKDLETYGQRKLA